MSIIVYMIFEIVYLRSKSRVKEALLLAIDQIFGFEECASFLELSGRVYLGLNKHEGS